MKRTLFSLSVMWIIALSSITSMSQETAMKTPPITAAQTLAEVEQYLNRLTTLIADFMQIAPNGEESHGTFFLSRPGKLRWQYEPPVPILIVVNGSLVTYFDQELNQVSHVPDQPLSAFLTRPNVRFDDPDILVKSIKREPGVVRITVQEKKAKVGGQLTMVFNEQPLQLRKLELSDAQHQQTVISFSNIQQGMFLDDKLFIIKDPQFFKNRIE